MIMLNKLDTIPGFESVHHFEQKSLDAIAIIAVHSSTLGPALGGCRLRDDYKNESEALTDVLRLAEGMTRKAAIHNRPFGGGKMAVWSRRPIEEIDRRALFHFVGRAVDTLDGSYITAEDLNTTVADMEIAREQSAYVAGIESGDPSEFTAQGVWEVVRYLAENHLHKPIQRCKLAIQGVGKVGTYLVRFATAQGIGEIVVADKVRKRAETAAKEFGCREIESKAIYDTECDIFVPCGFGGVLNPDTISRLRCKVVAGAANNQLEKPERDENLLLQRGILYCPDVIVNGGGMINVSCELPRYDRSRAEHLVRGIPETLDEVLHYAKQHDITPNAAVHTLTELRLNNAKVSKKAC